MTFLKNVVVLVLVRLLLTFATTTIVKGSKINTCSQQEQCIQFTSKSVNVAKSSSGSGEDCTFEICATTAFDLHGCSKDSTDTLYYTCVNNTNPNKPQQLNWNTGITTTTVIDATSSVVLPGQQAFGKDVRNGYSQCVTVAGGESVQFSFYDDDTCNGNDYNNDSNAAAGDLKIRCSPRSDDDASSCFESAVEKECVWTVHAPTCEALRSSSSSKHLISEPDDELSEHIESVSYIPSVYPTLHPSVEPTEDGELDTDVDEQDIARRDAAAIVYAVDVGVASSTPNVPVPTPVKPKPTPVKAPTIIPPILQPIPVVVNFNLINSKSDKVIRQISNGVSFQQRTVGKYLSVTASCNVRIDLVQFSMPGTQFTDSISPFSLAGDIKIPGGSGTGYDYFSSQYLTSKGKKVITATGYVTLRRYTRTKVFQKTITFYIT